MHVRLITVRGAARLDDAVDLIRDTICLTCVNRKVSARSV
jgi:hypothetical protein